MNDTVNKKSSIVALIAKAQDLFKKLSKREKGIIVIAALMITGTVTYQVYRPITDIFIAQTERQTDTETNMKLLSAALGKYARLRARQVSIEQAYREVEIKEGALSYLESLVRNKAGITSAFTIQERPVKQFGGNYEQAPFYVKFAISDFPRLISFLSEIVQGKHPLILGSLELKKRPSGDALDVTLDVSSIRRTSETNGQTT